MPKEKIEVSDAVLSWALDQAQNMDIPGKALALLRKWKNGEDKPTLKQLEDISKKTRIPVGYFFLQNPPKDECPLVEFRTVDSLALASPSRNLIDVVNEMSRIQEWAESDHADRGMESYRYVGSARPDESAAAIAGRMRSILELAVDWFSGAKGPEAAYRIARESAQDIGIIVMQNGHVGGNNSRKLNPGEFRAFALVSDMAPLVFINTADSPAARTFSLFHELAHIWLGENDLYNIQDSGGGNVVSRTETLCNAVAAEIICPSDLFRSKWEEGKKAPLEEKADAVAASFRCSSYVIVRRALDFGKITKEQYDSAVSFFAARYAESASKKQVPSSAGGPDYYKTLMSRMDRNLILALESSASSGRTLYTDVYSLTGLTGRSFRTLVGKYSMQT